MNDADRLTNLELLFTHLERQVAELNQVVLGQAEHIEQLQRQIRALQSPPEEEPSDDAQ